MGVWWTPALWCCPGNGPLTMSALWRINLWVTAFFALVTLACAVLLLPPATADVKRELQSAAYVLHYMSETAERNPASLQSRLTGSLRLARVPWLAAGQMHPVATEGARTRGGKG